MPTSGGKSWTANIANDETSIAAASLLRLLGGVAVATNADNENVQPLAQWLRHYSTSAHDFALPIGKWWTAFTFSSENNKPGIHQLAQVTLAVALLQEKARRGLEVDAASLDIIWGLIHEAIVGAQETKLQFLVSRNAQGFLAVPLCSLIQEGRIEELWRLHTWLPDGQRGDPEVRIHAHQPFGQSWSLLGSGTNCEFKVDSPDDASLTTHAAYECCYTYTGEHDSRTGPGFLQMRSTIRSTGRLVRVTPVSRELHTRDMSYSVPAGAYHQSTVSGSRMHATLFVFDAHRGYDDNAAVLGPKDGNGLAESGDADGITPQALARTVDAVRDWEKEQEVMLGGNDEHPTVIGYYRFFCGSGLLQAGRREDALQYFNPPKGGTPAHAFAREPSQQHRAYIKTLIEAGADLGLVDEAGFTALDYAVQNGDAETEALLCGQPSAKARA
ncbi:hypothetical protein J7T55_009811 [Diaporthe amygdali]|uniref:uncharacterized protein n=1 Tax=Phomopsis amygdali TaxID=1214568 RepID=UPI0022FEF922|nr:uncharacterized protein J7T55_009811 [Diaporthe amygdali]KAJ0116661.1 hypothetical protein J7T55_009811 [Diaporthe amygdali]